MIFTLLSSAVPSKGFINIHTDTLDTNTVLFKVSHPDFEAVSYLFGTHHAFGKPFFDSLQLAKEVLLSSEVMIKENLNLPGMLAVDHINRRSNTTKWSKYLNKNEYQFALDLFVSSKLMFDKMTPAELYAFLSRYYKEKVCIGKADSASYFSLDDYIASLAREQSIEIIGLETTEDQLSMINEDVRGMPRKVHKKRLSRMIWRINTHSHDLCSEINWYRSMNFDFKMEQACQNTLILTQRNNKWMAVLQDYFRSKNCFVAVGLSHLMFDCGLINQLIGLGYTVEPVWVK